MKQIYSARNEVDAEMAKLFLSNAGIDAVVQGGALSNILGEIPVTRETLPSLWVRDEDFTRATEVMVEFKHPTPVTGAAWKCQSCGEMSEPQFSACWKCGAARPG